MAVRDIGSAKLDGVSKALVMHQCHQCRFFRTVVYYTVLPIFNRMFLYLVVDVSFSKGIRHPEEFSLRCFPCVAD